MRNHRASKIIHEVSHRLWVVLGAVVMSLVLFIVLPMLQNISKPSNTDLFLQTVDLANTEPPPPSPPEEEPQKEPEPEEKPPELVEAAPPLDLSQLELALDPGIGQGAFGGGDFVVRLNSVVAASDTGGGDTVDAVFSMADLDQKPRGIYQPGPVLSREVRQKAPGTVYILFLVDERGGVVEPRVQQSTDPIFEKPALNAVKQWKFEPGKRGGKAVRFRMRVPFTFPKG
ncbi:MAG: energy transducer TonB [Phycisphaerales bacterium]